MNDDQRSRASRLKSEAQKRRWADYRANPNDPKHASYREKQSATLQKTWARFRLFKELGA